MWPRGALPIPAQSRPHPGSGETTMPPGRSPEEFLHEEQQLVLPQCNMAAAGIDPCGPASPSGLRVRPGGPGRLAARRRRLGTTFLLFKFNIVRETGPCRQKKFIKAVDTDANIRLISRVFSALRRAEPLRDYHPRTISDLPGKAWRGSYCLQRAGSVKPGVGRYFSSMLAL